LNLKSKLKTEDDVDISGSNNSQTIIDCFQMNNEASNKNKTQAEVKKVSLHENGFILDLNEEKIIAHKILIATGVITTCKVTTGLNPCPSSIRSPRCLRSTTLIINSKI